MSAITKEDLSINNTELKCKRKRKADSLGRLNVSNPVNSNNEKDDDDSDSKSSIRTNKVVVLGGRGSLDGWTSCPLCGKFSKKKYALGRGIAAHLIAIHTPWNPTKLSQKIARRQEEERQRLNNNGRQPKKQKIEEKIENQKQWIPSQEEKEAWDEQILQIMSAIEQKSCSIIEKNNNNTERKGKEGESDVDLVLDRSGNQVSSYRESLPEFLKAAANGDYDTLKRMVEEEKKKNDSATTNSAIQVLLDTKDRHLSTAEHWAAGGGHLNCLHFLLELRRQYCSSNNNSNQTKLRRRDGRTCLHYAARNGHLNCVEYLLQSDNFDVNEANGEGTTPFHMACYGGHPKTAKYLAKQGANVHLCNQWNCDASQFLGMTISNSTSEVRELCKFLKDRGLSFTRKQNQGHTILHKAAQKLNRHVIQWLADPSERGGAGLSEEQFEQIGVPDLGGHKASEMWRNFGGDASFEDWMKTFGW